MNIKKGDNVIIISGKDKGKKGKVTKAMPSSDKIVVEGVNIRKRHEKSRKQGQPGQIIEISTPIHVSNAMLVDGKSGKGTRAGIKMEGKTKTRTAKKGGAKV